MKIHFLRVFGIFLIFGAFSGLIQETSVELSFEMNLFIDVLVVIGAFYLSIEKEVS